MSDSDERLTISRRTLFGGAALSLLPAAHANQAQDQAGQKGQPRAAAGGGRVTPGGTGPIKVMLVTKGHPFDREGFFLLFDSMGKDITWTHVEQPASQVFFDPVRAKPYDVFVMYDLSGRTTGTRPDGTRGTVYELPSEEVRQGFKKMLQAGKGMVFLHHTIASWAHWPEYAEVMGGWGDIREPFMVRGKLAAPLQNRGNTEQHLTVVDKTHPITQGLGDGFDIKDEVFLAPYFEDSVHPLIRTSFENPLTHNLHTWVKTAERSPIIYIQSGHDAQAWDNPGYRLLLSNAIKWAGSKEALSWAAEHPVKIFT